MSGDSRWLELNHLPSRNVCYFDVTDVIILIHMNIN